MHPWNPNTKSTGRPRELNPGSSDRPFRSVRTVSQSPEPLRQVSLDEVMKLTAQSSMHYLTPTCLVHFQAGNTRRRRRSNQWNIAQQTWQKHTEQSQRWWYLDLVTPWHGTFHRLAPHGTTSNTSQFNLLIHYLQLGPVIVNIIIVNFSTFNSQPPFPAGPGLAGTRMFPFQILLELRVIEMVVTTGAIRHAKLQSKCHHQHTSTQFLYRPDALPVAQPTVSKHWREKLIKFNY